MKNFLLLFAFAALIVGAQTANAQTTRTIEEIMTIGDSVANNDTSIYNGDLVRVRGVITFEPLQWYQQDRTLSGQSTERITFFIQDSGNGGPKHSTAVYWEEGADVISKGQLTALAVGTYIEVVGEVTYFSGIIEIDLGGPNASVNVIQTGVPLAPRPEIPLSELNDELKVAQESGHKWESVNVCLIGSYTVTLVNGNSARGDFDVVDALGNTIDVWDAHIDFRLSQNGFVKPVDQSTFSKVCGVIGHRAFDPSPQDRFEIWPTTKDDLELSEAPPIISGVVRDVACPGDAANVVVTANVETLPTASPLKATNPVRLRFNKGTSLAGGTQTVNMTETAPGSGTWTGTIPATFANNGELVYYWIEAENDTTTGPTEAGLVGRAPRYSPYCFTVNNNGCTISDIQRTPDETVFVIDDFDQRLFDSGYDGLEVTVTGTVTATRDDLGYVFIKEDGANTWGSIWLQGNALIDAFNLGDEVTVTGEVDEYFNWTYIDVTSGSVVTAGTPGSQVAPLDLPLNTFNSERGQTYVGESYESALVSFDDANLQVVIDTSISSFDSDRGDYIVGTDPFAPDNGVQVSVGRQTSSYYGSLSFPYINDCQWAINDGTMTVQGFVVEKGFGMTSLAGVMSYQWNKNKLMPRTEADITGEDNTGLTACTTTRWEEAASPLFIYPNPANDRITFEVPGTQTLAVRMVDLTGRVLVNETVNVAGGQGQLAIYNVPTGTYVLHAVNTQGEAYVARVVVSR